MLKIAIAALILAASGDWIYESTDFVDVSPGDAAGLADNYIDLAAWTGNRADMNRCTVEKTSDGFQAKCKGNGKAAPADVPEGVAVAGWDGSDRVYEYSVTVEITAQQAVGLADAFIAVGAWLGNRANMIRCTVERYDPSPTNFRAFCIGNKTADPANVPSGAMFVGRVP